MNIELVQASPLATPLMGLESLFLHLDDEQELTAGEAVSLAGSSDRLSDRDELAMRGTSVVIVSSFIPQYQQQRMSTPQ